MNTKATNQNVDQNWYADHIDEELDCALNRFDNIINEAFGLEVTEVKHVLYNSSVSFSHIAFSNGDVISFRINSMYVNIETYNASAEHLKKAFKAFGIEDLPYWLYEA